MTQLLERTIETSTQVPTFELQAKTEAGKRLVELAEQHAADFATRAANHDLDGSYPFENIEALKDSGYSAAPIPVELGGLGVDSWHDLYVAATRLARGDPSVTIGINMHIIGAANVARRYQVLKAKDDPRAQSLGMALAAIARGKQIIAAAVSEPGQDLTHPATMAVPAEGGWRVSGTKIFATMSPAADALFVAVTQVGQGEDRYAFALVPSNSPGVTVNDDWDALGMRSSGSGSVTLTDVFVPNSAFFAGWQAGVTTSDLLENFLPSGLFHAAASLGIAEQAHASIVESLAKKRKGGDVSAHTLITSSQNAIELFAMRSAFERAANLVDHFYTETTHDQWSVEFVAGYMAEVQSAKTFINEAAQRVVDRALTLSGGAGFMTKHPLSRAYRDVRAGAFMHPLGANRAFEFIGNVTLGLQPSLA